MSTAEGTVAKGLGIALDALGKERGGKVACLVLVCDGQLELIYPDRTSQRTMQTIEVALVASILAEDRL